MKEQAGQKRRWWRYFQEGPPDLLSLIKNFFNPKSDNIWQANANKNGPALGGSPKKLIMMVVGAIVVLWALMGIYIVAPAEQAVILRFGKYHATMGPGPHWIARGIDSKQIVNIQQVSNTNYAAEMLTEDENIVSVQIAVQYRIDNPRDYLFNVVSPQTTLQQAISSALRQIVGTMTLDSVLTTGREELRAAVSTQLNKTLAAYNVGYLITDVNLQPAKPPAEVVHAFDDAIKAREDEQAYINKAQAYNRQELSKVQGQVARIRQSADAYKQQVVLKANGDTARYLALLKPYLKSPTVTEKRLYLDTVSDVLSQTTNILVGSGKGNNNMLYLPLDQLIKSRGRTPVMNASKVNLPSSVDALTKSMSSPASAKSTTVDTGYTRPSYNEMEG